MTVPALKFNPAEARSLAAEVMDRSGQNLLACYQCRRCAAGCPVAEETAFLTPDRLIRLILVGEREAALENGLVWKCVSCYTCGTRCPNDIQTARITETLKKMAKASHAEPLEPRIANFHDAFFGSAMRFGRVNELEFMGVYELKNSLHFAKKGKFRAIFDELLAQAKFALPLLTHHRMHFGFQASKGRRELKRLQKKARSRSSQ